MAPSAIRAAGALCLLATWIHSSSVAQAQPAAARPAASGANADEQAIRAGAQAYAKAYNARDASALAAMWTEEGEYINEDGEVLIGRAAIERHFADLFASGPGAKLEVKTESIRFVSPDLAIESGVARAIPEHGHPTTAGYTATQVKQDGHWLLASVRDVRRLAESNHEYLAGLDWTIGHWQAEMGDERLTVRFDWVPSKNFLMRTFAVEKQGKQVRSGTQIIGWDPRIEEITSWQFDSDGGFSQQQWNKQGARWFIENDGVQRDGGETYALNIVTPIDANSFTWQSTLRSLAGKSLPDTPPIKLTRIPTSK